MSAFPFNLSLEDVASGFRLLNHKDTIRSSGLCMRSLEFLFIAQPLNFTEWMSTTMGNPEEYKQQIVTARALGKKQSYSELDHLRLVIPLESWMSLADALISNQLEMELRRAFPHLLSCSEPDGYFMGANRYTQPLDIAFGCQIMVEKALDMESCGGLAQFDIRQFYDSLPLVRLYQYLLELGVDTCLVKAAMFHQLLPKLVVQLSSVTSTSMDESSVVRHRATGGLTGSRTAGSLAKFIIACMMTSCRPQLLPYGFASCMFTSTWVDNIYTTGKSASAALEMARVLEDHWSLRWGLHIKAGSKLVMAVKGGTGCDTPNGWKQVDVFPVLGHYVSFNGNIDVCYGETTKEAWRAFWRNTSKRCVRTLPNILRAKRLARMVLPVFRYRWTRWPYTAWRASILDKLQRRMIGICMAYEPAPHADTTLFWRGRAKAAGNLANQSGRWSTLWAKAVVAWDDHLQRSRNSHSWANAITSLRDRDELAWRRASFGGRPRTRVEATWTCRRWQDGLVEAKTCAQ